MAGRMWVLQSAMVVATLGTVLYNAAESQRQEELTTRLWNIDGASLSLPLAALRDTWTPDPPADNLRPPPPPSEPRRQTTMLLRTAQTIEAMVSVFKKEGMEAHQDPLMSELMQLSHEIDAAMNPTRAGKTPTAIDIDSIVNSIDDMDTFPITTTITEQDPPQIISDHDIPISITFRNFTPDPFATTPPIERESETATTIRNIFRDITPDPFTTKLTTIQGFSEGSSPATSSSNSGSQQDGPQMTPDPFQASLGQVFFDRFKFLLEASGIELVLPLDCGRNPIQEADPTQGRQVPWVVALGSREDGRFYYRCVGVILTNQHVLTDADCAASPNVNVVQVSRSGRVPDEGAEENFVAGRRIHPDIRSREDLFSGVNVGILELARPFIFQDSIQPVCLPGLLDEVDHFDHHNATVVAYVNITDDLRQGRRAELVALSTPILGSALCFERTNQLNQREPDVMNDAILEKLNEKHICAGIDFEEVGKSVVLARERKTGRVQVVGVGGFASASTTIPVVYTFLQPHRFWVDVVLKQYLDNTARQRQGQDEDQEDDDSEG